MIEERMPSGMKAATTITSGKKETNAFPAERDAAIDELDLEHALPHAPQEHVLHASPHAGAGLAHLDAACAPGRRLADQTRRVSPRRPDVSTGFSASAET